MVALRTGSAVTEDVVLTCLSTSVAGFATSPYVAMGRPSAVSPVRQIIVPSSVSSEVKWSTSPILSAIITPVAVLASVAVIVIKLATSFPPAFSVPSSSILTPKSTITGPILLPTSITSGFVPLESVITPVGTRPPIWSPIATGSCSAAIVLVTLVGCWSKLSTSLRSEVPSPCLTRATPFPVPTVAPVVGPALMAGAGSRLTPVIKWLRSSVHGSPKPGTRGSSATIRSPISAVTVGLSASCSATGRSPSTTGLSPTSTVIGLGMVALEPIPAVATPIPIITIIRRSMLVRSTVGSKPCSSSSVCGSIVVIISQLPTSLPRSVGRPPGSKPITVLSSSSTIAVIAPIGPILPTLLAIIVVIRSSLGLPRSVTPVTSPTCSVCSS